MCEFETATDAPITYAELEVLIRLIIEDFTLLHIPEHTRSLSGSLLGYKTIP